MLGVLSCVTFATHTISEGEVAQAQYIRKWQAQTQATDYDCR